MREIVLDTETTGLDYKTGDRIIEIGCVELINHIPTENYLQFYCSTDKKISNKAINIHGLTNDFLKDHPTFKEQSKKFLDFIKNDILIIHNADFDVGFINNELKLIGADSIKNKVIDTVLLARKKLKTRIANLDYLCRRFSINLEARTFHGALLDCYLLAGVYLELVGGKQRSLDLVEASIEITSKKNKQLKNSYNISKITINEKEIESHKNFVKNLKNAIWHKLDY